jgi:hypothetical protein
MAATDALLRPRHDQAFGVFCLPEVLGGLRPMRIALFRTGGRLPAANEKWFFAARKSPPKHMAAPVPERFG